MHLLLPAQKSSPTIIVVFASGGDTKLLLIRRVTPHQYVSVASDPGNYS